jgi:hypothetical protein
MTMRTKIFLAMIGAALFGASDIDAAPFEYYQAVVHDRAVTKQVTAINQAGTSTRSTPDASAQFLAFGNGFLTARPEISAPLSPRGQSAA